MAASNIPKIAITEEGDVTFSCSPRLDERGRDIYVDLNNVLPNTGVKLQTVSETIYATVDGSQPTLDNWYTKVTHSVTTEGKRYSTTADNYRNLVLSKGQTIKYFGYLDNIQSSIQSVTHGSTDITLATIRVNKIGNELGIIRDFGSGNIYYTTNGDDPITKGIKVNDDSVRLIYANTTIKCCIKYFDKHSDVLTYVNGVIEAPITTLSKPEVKYDEASHEFTITNNNRKDNNGIGSLYYTVDGSEPTANNGFVAEPFTGNYIYYIQSKWKNATFKFILIYNDIKSDVVTYVLGDGEAKIINTPTVIISEDNKSFKVTSDTPYGQIEVQQGDYPDNRYILAKYNEFANININCSPILYITATYEYQTKKVTQELTNLEILTPPTISMADGIIGLKSDELVDIYYKFDIYIDWHLYTDTIKIPEQASTIKYYSKNKYYTSNIVETKLIVKPSETTHKIKLYGSENKELKTNKFNSYIDVIYNDRYSDIKCLNSINYILSKITQNINYNITSEELLNNTYSGDYMVVFSDNTYSGLLQLQHNNIAQNCIEDYKFPHREKGVWNFNYFRNNITTAVTEEELLLNTVVPYYNEKTNKTEYRNFDINELKKLYKRHNEYEQSDLRSLIYGKYFIARFIFLPNKGNTIKLETISFNTQNY